MLDVKTNQAIMYWLARIWSLLALVFLIFMVGAHVVEAGNSGKPFFEGFSKDELISFICFPIGIMLALIVVQFKYRLGGILGVLFGVGFLISRPDLIEAPMIYIFIAPCLLFLIYSYLKP